MNPPDKTRAQLIAELAQVHRRAAELESALAKHDREEVKIRVGTGHFEAPRQSALENSAELRLEALLRSIISRATRLLGANGGRLYLYHPERDVLEWAARFGPEVVPIGTALRRGEGLPGRIWETGKPLIVDDYDGWEGQSDSWTGFTVAVVGAPICWRPADAGEEFLGVLTINKAVPQTFSEDDAQILELLAARAAVAIKNARLFEAEQEQREFAKALEDAAAAVGSTLDLDQVLDIILEQVARIVSGDTFNVMLVEGENARVVRWRGYEEIDPDGQVSRFLAPIACFPSLTRMAQTGKPSAIPDTAGDPEWVKLEGREWMHSHIATPIRIGETTLGFLNVGGVRSNQFSPADVQRLQGFAGHAAAAIENARLHRELRDHAERLEERVRSRTAQLEAQYARLEAILDSTADGILVTDANGRILQTNPPAHTWLTQTLSPENAQQLRAMVRDLVRRLEEQPREMLELAGLDMELRATPISERGKDNAAAVVAIHDVSQLKALDRMKTRFVSNVSHELRTPITTIKLYTALMQRTEPTEWRDYLGALAEEADRQVQLVENILQISRIDAGRTEMNRRSISINELTAAAVDRHQVLAQERGHRLTHRPNDPEPMGWVDQDQIMQVLNNLVENGIHYTPDGGEVTVSTGTAQADGRTWVTATVTDTGTGIPESEMPHIFERFHRGEGPLQIKTPGTGLGLAIAKEITELHGGWITAESKVNVGSTFTVWLPAAESRQTAIER